jgi:hypothetical protein
MDIGYFINGKWAWNIMPAAEEFKNLRFDL